jgi:5-methyltetrahydrofolate--homocysteine methyltransferase
VKYQPKIQQNKTMIYQPKQEGIVTLQDIDLHTISKYIHWNFFFLAWKVTGIYDGIESLCTCPSCEVAWLQKISIDKRDKAKEALRLLRDAQQLLAQIVTDKTLTAKVTFCITKAKSENEGVIFFTENKPEGIYIPMLRQQQEKDSEFCLSLADFVSPVSDYAGIFAVSVSGADELKKKFDAEDDTYNSLLVQTLADRLAEATTEWMHEQIRKNYWGYAPDENLSIADMLKTQYQGIRPAVGYPSLPDQSIIFTLNEILHFDKIGISITENGAMYPTASTCGLIFAHPKSNYFMVGRIGEDQLADYANRKGTSTEEVKKWLSAYM